MTNDRNSRLFIAESGRRKGVVTYMTINSGVVEFIADYNRMLGIIRHHGKLIKVVSSSTFFEVCEDYMERMIVKNDVINITC